MPLGVCKCVYLCVLVYVYLCVQEAIGTMPTCYRFCKLQIIHCTTFCVSLTKCTADYMHHTEGCVSPMQCLLACVVNNGHAMKMLSQSNQRSFFFLLLQVMFFPNFFCQHSVVSSSDRSEVVKQHKATKLLTNTNRRKMLTDSSDRDHNKLPC